MEWAALAGLIAQYGLPLAIKLYEKWNSKEAVTPAEIEELKKLASQNAITQMQAALDRAGIPSNDPRAAELLRLVSGKTAPEPPPAGT